MRRVGEWLDRKRGEARRGAARLHAGRNPRGHHHHRADHGLVGPRVLNYLERIQGQGREDPDRKLFQRARSLLPRRRTLSDQPEGLTALVRARQQRGLERAVSARRRGSQRSLGPRLCLSSPGQEGALRHHFLRLRRTGRRNWRGSRHHQLAALTRGRERRFHADRNRRACSPSSACSPPSSCRRSRAAPRARGSKPMRSKPPRC